MQCRICGTETESNLGICDKCVAANREDLDLLVEVAKEKLQAERNVALIDFGVWLAEKFSCHIDYAVEANDPRMKVTVPKDSDFVSMLFDYLEKVDFSPEFFRACFVDAPKKINGRTVIYF